jgi:shikimate dehydrogenase
MKKFKFGVLGHNISYSLSPKIFDVIFDYSTIDGESSILDWSKEELHNKFNELLNYDGLSITIPFKKEIIKYLDDIRKPANLIQSVNSIQVKNDNLIGYNTDYKGFVLPLRKHSQKINNCKIITLGYGGSTRAVLYGLTKEFEIIHADIIIRDISKSKEIENEVTQLFPKMKISLKSFNDNINLSAYKLIVNTTPLGSVNYPDSLPFGNNPKFDSNSIYYDLNYNSDNKAIKLASESNLSVIDGRQMLLAQAIESFKIWTNIEVPLDIVFEKIFPEKRLNR